MILLLLALLWTWPAAAQEPIWHRVTRADGLEANWVRDIHQRSDGVLALGTSVGVFSWDGDRATRIDGGRIRTVVERVEPFGDALAAHDSEGRVWHIAGEQTRQLRLHEDRRARDIAWSGSVLAVLDDAGELWKLGPDGALTRPDLPVPPGASRLWARADDLLLASAGGWFAIRDGELLDLGRPRRGVEDGLITSDGRFFAADREAAWELSPGADPVSRWPLGRHRSALAERGGAVWVAYDGLIELLPSGAARRFDEGAGLWDRGDALHVDAEGGLWVGGSQGVAVVLEPDLVRWTAEHGLASNAPRRLALHEGSVWVNHWIGLSILRDDTVSVDAGAVSPGRVCVDGAGVAWMVDRRSTEDATRVMRRIDEQGTDLLEVPAGAPFYEGCTTDEHGAVWYTIGDGLYRMRGARMRRVGALPEVPRGTDRTLHVADGVASFTEHRSFCQAQLELLSGAGGWACGVVPGERKIVDMNRDEAGRFWLVGVDAGVLVGGPGDWRVPPSARELPGAHLTFVEPSPRGGVWLGGEGPLIRVSLDPASGDWRVLERLDGLLSPVLARTVDLVEAPSGELYVSVWFALIRVGAEARDRALPPPPLLLREAFVDGVAVHEAAGPIRLRGSDSTLELRMAVPSYRSRRDLRVRSRVDGQAWSAPSPGFSQQWNGLAAGTRRIEVQASRDGRTWGPTWQVQVQVPRPWYGRWEPWLLAGLVLVGLIGAIWRARLLLALREERIRGQVASDLHDEVGAELGALRLLAGLLARELPADRRETVAARAIRSIEGLTSSVRGIVWSMQPARPDLSGLAHHLAERARVALPDLEGRVHIRVDAPGQRVELNLAVVRAVRLILREALHNVAKHSQASQVWLTVEPAGPRRWRVVLRDDGVGFDVDAAEGQGTGLRSMRERARDVGAHLSLSSSGEGTRLCLEFPVRR